MSSGELFTTRHRGASSWRMVRLTWQQVVGQGAASRRQRIPYGACPYTEEPNRTFWQRGWKGLNTSQVKAVKIATEAKKAKL